MWLKARRTSLLFLKKKKQKDFFKRCAAGAGQGGSPYPSLQQAWTRHGEREFRFEELDSLKPDFPYYGRITELKMRQALWRTRLQAASL
jgi:hypothetical protein